MKIVQNLKTNIAAYLLGILKPDSKKVIGEKVALELEKAKVEFWLILKDINYEIAEEFGGGIHGDVDHSELIGKVRKMRHAYKLAALRNQRVANALQVQLEDVVDETKELINEVDELNKVKDAVLPSLRSAARAVARVEKIEEESIEKEKEGVEK